MDWITDTIGIGSFHEAMDGDLLRREKVRSILGLTAALKNTNPIDLGVDRIEILTLLDGPGNELRRFADAVAILEELRQIQVPCWFIVELAGVGLQQWSQAS